MTTNTDTSTRATHDRTPHVAKLSKGELVTSIEAVTRHWLNRHWLFFGDHAYHPSFYLNFRLRVVWSRIVDNEVWLAIGPDNVAYVADSNLRSDVVAVGPTQHTEDSAPVHRTINSYIDNGVRVVNIKEEC